MNIGNVTQPGSTTLSNGTYTIQGSGADIYNETDDFRFLYQGLSGDGQIVARIVDVNRGPPLGVGQDSEYVESTEPVQPGSTLVVFTDGLVEQPGEPVDVMLATLAKNALAGPDDPDELCDHLVREQVGGGQPRDDVAFVAVHTVPLSGDPARRASA